MRNTFCSPSETQNERAMKTYTKHRTSGCVFLYVSCVIGAYHRGRSRQALGAGTGVLRQKRGVKLDCCTVGETICEVYEWNILTGDAIEGRRLYFKFVPPRSRNKTTQCFEFLLKYQSVVFIFGREKESIAPGLQVAARQAARSKSAAALLSCVSGLWVFHGPHCSCH